MSSRDPRPQNVAVVGAGMVGLATAWFLQEAGAVVTDARGGVMTFNNRDPSISGVLAATADQHPALLAILRAASHGEES